MTHWLIAKTKSRIRNLFDNKKNLFSVLGGKPDDITVVLATVAL